MLQRCPHCDKPLQPMRYGVGFGPLAIRIIDAIETAGPGGISSADLFGAVYRERNGATVERLKGYIGTINASLAGKGLAIRIDRSTDRVFISQRMARRDSLPPTPEMLSPTVGASD